MTEPKLDVTVGAAIAIALFYYLDDSGWFSAVLPTILCHEGGHWIAVRAVGGKIHSLRLELSGFCMETSAFTRKKEEIIALMAGPAAGLIWAAAAKTIGGAWGEKSARVSLALNLFNLLPALPLDGGRILLSASDSHRLVRILGGIVAVGMIVISLVEGFWGLMIPGFYLGENAVRPGWREDYPPLSVPAGKSEPGKHA